MIRIGRAGKLLVSYSLNALHFFGFLMAGFWAIFSNTALACPSLWNLTSVYLMKRYQYLGFRFEDVSRNFMCKDFWNSITPAYNPIIFCFRSPKVFSHLLHFKEKFFSFVGQYFLKKRSRTKAKCDF